MKKILCIILFFIAVTHKINCNQESKKQEKETTPEKVTSTTKIRKTDLLYDYVHKLDNDFKWEKVDEEKFPNKTVVHELKLTSQRWKDILWTHYILIAQPENIKTTISLLTITGGDIGTHPKKEHKEFIAKISENINAITSILYTVPNQPLFGKLREDDLISFTLVKALTTGDLEWACLLPMVKSAVKSMDTIQEFSKEVLKIEISGFVVTGASKRGWTTWLTASVDNRVKGIMPRVYDNLNIPLQMNHQIEVFGKHSEEIKDYTKRGLTFLATSIFAQPLVRLVDPYSYKEKINIPKLIVNGTNDRYWTLDAANFYFDNLAGEKYIQYIPNNGHDIEDQERVTSTAIAFFNYICGRLKFPEVKWEWLIKNEGIKLIIKSNPQPERILIWIANSDTKNFHNSKWESIELNTSESSYLLKKPESGYSSAFAELFFEINQNKFSLTTTLRIVGEN